jgi:hypothetical protein
MTGSGCVIQFTPAPRRVRHLQGADRRQDVLNPDHRLVELPEAEEDKHLGEPEIGSEDAPGVTPGGFRCASPFAAL